MSEVVIRQATKEDAETILGFIRELAIYEKAEHEVVATVQDIENNLFCEKTTTDAVICLYQGKPIGFAVYFMSFSTWQGRNGLYLEDLFVSPEYRGLGAGKELLTYLAKTAVDNNCARFEWSVLDWNEPSIKFYESLSAIGMPEWIRYRLDGQALINLAGK